MDTISPMKTHPFASRFTFVALEELFNNKNHFFFRIHKKHFINLHYVQSVTRKSDYVLMTDGAKIPIAKKNSPFFNPKIFLELSTH